MKFKVAFKDPDVLEEAIRATVAESMRGHTLSADEYEAAAEVRYESVAKSCRRWFDYGEYVTVEVDTDAGTCTVVPVNS